MLPDIFFSPSFSLMKLLTKTCYKNRSFTTRQGFEYSLFPSLFLLCSVVALLGWGWAEKAEKVAKKQQQLEEKKILKTVWRRLIHVLLGWTFCLHCWIVSLPAVSLPSTRWKSWITVFVASNLHGNSMYDLKTWLWLCLILMFLVLSFTYYVKIFTVKLEPKTIE